MIKNTNIKIEINWEEVDREGDPLEMMTWGGFRWEVLGQVWTRLEDREEIQIPLWNLAAWLAQEWDGIFLEEEPDFVPNFEDLDWLRGHSVRAGMRGYKFPQVFLYVRGDEFVMKCLEGDGFLEGGEYICSVEEGRRILGTVIREVLYWVGYESENIERVRPLFDWSVMEIRRRLCSLSRLIRPSVEELEADPGLVERIFLTLEGIEKELQRPKWEGLPIIPDLGDGYL